MKVSQLRCNHVDNPLGFELDRLSLSWITEVGDRTSKFQQSARVEIAYDTNFEQMVHDSGQQQHIDSLAYQPEVQLKPRTRYYWRVTVWGDAGDVATSEIAWFETAKMNEPWQGKWITPELDQETHPLMRKLFQLPNDVSSNLQKARIYLCGVGLYELEMNGQRVSEEYLAPGYHSYDYWLQYQTYDVTELLANGDNAIGVALGNGWYKGRFGFEEGLDKWFGDSFALLAELIVTLNDGTEIIVATDTTWRSAPGPVQFSNIYDGEIYDATKEIANWSHSSIDDQAWHGVRETTVNTERLQARLNLPIKIMEQCKPVEIIHTPAGETVLDFGQIMTGWVSFKTSASEGSKIHLQYGEILQEDNFYRDNLRTAKAEFIYIANGSEVKVRPHFTFFGFRYVKVQGFEGELKAEDFTANVVHSELVQTGSIETSNPLVNRLFLNALWGQKGNFLDVPTDCPQRDERMGWTGDAQVFAPTACFNMYSPAFYTKYMTDLREEQLRLGGSVPFTVPSIRRHDGVFGGKFDGSAAWGDAATVIPWTLYVNYGDKELLRSQFQTMKGWVDYIKGIDEASGGRRLWTEGFHFGDWLALDGKDPKSPFGGTDEYYIASAYYCYSAQLVAKAAEVLGENELAGQYATLAEEIKAAMLNEYFTPSGRIAIATQTAMIVALYMNIVPEHMRERVVQDLQAKLAKDNMHLTTGFVGTPYLCLVLSEHDATEAAYTLLLNDDYPSWLYAVKLGATTIWERWNSVLADGSISDTGMNSLNHYAYGSIAQWMYQHMCGINPVAEAPGYRKILLSPKPSSKLNYAKASFQSPSGLIESGWSLGEDGSLTYRFTVPFNTTAEVVLPDAELAGVTVNGAALQEVGRQENGGAGAGQQVAVQQAELIGQQQGNKVSFALTAGSYAVRYMPTRSYVIE